MTVVKINTALSIQRDMLRYWQTDNGAAHAEGVAEIARACNTPDLMPELWNLDPENPDRVALAAALQHRTRICATYWTKTEMVDLTYAASNGRPGTAIFYGEMPHMHGFSIFETPMLVDMGSGGRELIDPTSIYPHVEQEKIAAELGTNNLVNLAGFQWNHGQVNGVSGVEVILFSDPKDRRDGLVSNLHGRKLTDALAKTPPLLLLNAFFIPYGVDFAEDDVWHAIVATWWHLIMQPISTSHVENANPQMTKRAKKLELVPSITVVTLRPRKPTPGDPGNKKIVNWTRRWLVGADKGGVWRRQWYPSLGIHKTIFISVYEKGPLDKPLIIKRAKLYAWRR